MSKKLGQEPAFACTSTESEKYDAYLQKGISTRLFIATQIMAGICSDSSIDLDTGLTHNVALAYKVTDELLKQEAKYNEQQ